MRHINFFVAIFLFHCVADAQDSTFIRGADISAAPQIENAGGVWKLNGSPHDLLDIFKQSGANYIRLRLWHSPSDGYCGLDSTTAFAEKAKARGFKFLLDIHYSDTWADPGHQTKPAAWANLSFTDLTDSVYSYTKNVISVLKNHNAIPDMVQIGNEITGGMLWPDGKLNGSTGWSNFAALLKAGIRGVKDIDTTVHIMIHIDKGGDNSASRWFFDNLTAQGVNFDVIGLSYYPWWQGTLPELQSNVNDLASRYNKKIVVAETAYPWTLSWNDNVPNIVGDSSQLLPEYPATVDGQRNFLNGLIQTVLNIPNNKGMGFFYWEPDWISAPQLGSSWENLALFDFAGNAANSFSVFNSTPVSVSQRSNVPASFALHQNYPNPFNPTTHFRFSIANFEFVTLKVYDLLGREIATLVNGKKSPGTYEVLFDGSKLPSGVYFYRLESGRFAETKKLILIK